MRRVLLLAAAGVCFVHPNAVAQGHGPDDFDPRPLESAYGMTEADRGSVNLFRLDPESMTLLQAKASAPAQKWHFDFMLYGLFGNLYGDTTVKGHSADIDIGTQEILNNLQFTSAGRARLAYEKLFVAVDILYLGLAGSTDSPPADMTFHQWIGQAIVGYSVSDRLDAFAGARYNQLSSEVDFQGPIGLQASGLQAWWDPILGGVWKNKISEHFGYQIYLDVGGFGITSKITTKFEPMISWYFSKHASLDLAYDVYYDDYANTSEGFAYNAVIYGLLVGLSVHF